MKNANSDLSSNTISYYFSSLEAPRRIDKGNYPHLLSAILLLTISALLSGADTWQTVYLFGESQEKWLKQ